MVVLLPARGPERVGGQSALPNLGHRAAPAARNLALCGSTHAVRISRLLVSVGIGDAAEPREEEAALGAELERLYELDELKTLSSGLLGLDPDELGGTTAKGSFARALARRC